MVIEYSALLQFLALHFLLHAVILNPARLGRLCPSIIKIFRWSFMKRHIEGDHVVKPVGLDNRFTIGPSHFLSQNERRLYL